MYPQHLNSTNQTSGQTAQLLVPEAIHQNNNAVPGECEQVRGPPKMPG